MTPAYLHEPITTAEQVDKILKSKTVEGQHFEWKGNWWEDSGDETAAEEAAKDVSSMLNADGGTILVGVDQDKKRSRASQPFYRPAKDGAPERCFKLGKRQKQLEDWLHERLEPSEARTYVSYEPLKVQWNGKEWDVLAVNVSPYPHGAVAAVYRQSKDLYRFVVREGEHAREMAWEEVVRRNEAGNRAMYLRLKALEGKTRKVVIRSPMQVRIEGRGIPVFPDPKAGHGDLLSAEPDGLSVNMHCQDTALAFLRKQAASNVPEEKKLKLGGLVDLTELPLHYMVEQAAGFDSVPHKTRIPFSMIDSAWKDDEIPSTLNVILRCTVRWEAGHWSLTTSG